MIHSEAPEVARCKRRIDLPARTSRALKVVIVGPLNVWPDPVLLNATLGMVAELIEPAGVPVLQDGLALTSVSTAVGVMSSRRSIRTP